MRGFIASASHPDRDHCVGRGVILPNTYCSASTHFSAEWTGPLCPTARGTKFVCLVPYSVFNNSELGARLGDIGPPQVSKPRLSLCLKIFPM